MRGLMFVSIGCLVMTGDAAEGPTAQPIIFHGYTTAIELQAGSARAVVAPEAGGRVLDFSWAGDAVLFLDEKEKQWRRGQPPMTSAGRFDVGPELTVTPHKKLWSGDWTGQVSAPGRATLLSPKDEVSGMQLQREFSLTTNAAGIPTLHCQQTIMNIGVKPMEVCHWGRSFSVGGGICIVPLGDRPSRFPGKYALYEDHAIINVRNTDPNIRVRDGVVEILAPPRKPKLGFDATAGLIAYLLPCNKVFVKRFAVHPERVYNEAAGITISVWYPEKADRIELEPIGPREVLAPGQAASFSEHWSIHEYPFPKAGETIDVPKLLAVIQH